MGSPVIVALINNCLSIWKKNWKPVHFVLYALTYKMLIKSKECIRNLRKKYTANAVLVSQIKKLPFLFYFAFSYCCVNKRTQWQWCQSSFWRLQSSQGRLLKRDQSRNDSHEVILHFVFRLLKIGKLNSRKVIYQLQDIILFRSGILTSRR